MENAKPVEYVGYQLKLEKETQLMHEAMTRKNYEQAIEHCMNMQVEMKLLTTAVRSWIKEK
jgi:hypothetical protein